MVIYNPLTHYRFTCKVFSTKSSLLMLKPHSTALCPCDSVKTSVQMFQKCVYFLLMWQNIHKKVGHPLCSVIKTYKLLFVLMTYSLKEHTVLQFSVISSYARYPLCLVQFVN